MTGSKQVVHWTSESWCVGSEIACSQHKELLFKISETAKVIHFIILVDLCHKNIGFFCGTSSYMPQNRNGEKVNNFQPPASKNPFLIKLFLSLKVYKNGLNY
jgi:hypothetical protein